ncbi:MFS transporter [Alicyclobacillus dauci]|uniref:MFS transporter n=1 Tax=Alicyclobacillus dauci TaxID=1475485 RepID=A0ABY6Z034_9BACL|nr:MFS transporter [Alicyclobacillus dauci]WAH36115.1 MFS transporter [Alicyclobacillus dauci]
MKGQIALRSTVVKLRGFYFSTGLSGGILVPYISILLEHDGFQSGTVGIVMAIGTFISLLTQPIWGYVVDRFQMTRLTLAMSSMFPGLLAILFDANWLWVIVLANSLWNIFTSPQSPISDAYTVVNAPRAGATYGSVRMFGSLGFAIGGYLSGEYLARFPVTSLWIPYLVVAALGAAIAFYFPQDRVEFASTISIRSGITSLMRNKRFVFFLLGGFLVSQTLTAFNTYFALTFRAMGGSLAMTGVAFFIASGTNVPAMLIARNVIQRLGRERTLLIACVAYVLRWAVQAFLPIPWLALVIQILHGISFGFYYVAAVDFVSENASRDMQATAQSIFGMICSGLAGIVGNLLNGFLLRYGGPELMYSVCMVSSLIGAGCFLVVARLRTTSVIHPSEEDVPETIH